MMDLFSDDMRRNPYPVYDQMRTGSPVLHLAPFDLWMIFDYEGVKRALTDHDAFSSDLSHAPGQGNPGSGSSSSTRRATRSCAPSSRKAFTPRVVANLEPRIRELSRELLDQAIERGEMDLAADFAVPLPMHGDRGDARRPRRGLAAVQALERRDPEARQHLLRRTRRRPRASSEYRRGHGRDEGLPAGPDRAAAGGAAGRPADPARRGRGGRRAADAGGDPGLRAAPARRRPARRPRT